MAPIARAENVLQRADELVKMDKASSALELLYDTINSKRTRFVSLDTQEPLILKFIELSVDLRAGKNVRDALHQFKKMTVATNTQSLALAVDTFLNGCRRKAKEAQAEAKAIVIDEDLEAEQSPEDLLLATVSSEQTKDRTDREVVTPWLKFLWEGYRSVLDVLRNNNKLEDLYAKTVSQAFQFCLEYNRKTEFRRLCELLRNHLLQAAQQPKQPQAAQTNNPIDINDPDTLQMLINIRFEQLKVAVKLELWQEAFRSVEGIHVLFSASRRPIKINHLATYYETMARICAVSDNYLFHAASWAKYYGMVYNTRETAPEGELARIASVFYLSVLCIPGNAGASVSPGQNRLTTLLNMGRVPTRDSLIAFSLSKNILNYVRPEIKDLNRLLEADFHPLTLKKRLGPILESLGKFKEFTPYIKPLLDVVVNRTFLQLAQSYTAVKIDFIVNILTFTDSYKLSRFEIEKALVFATHSNFVKAKINHQGGSVTFVDTLSTREPNSVEDILQPTPSTLTRNQLADYSSCFQEVLAQADDAEMRRINAARKNILAVAERGLAKENSEFLNRKKLQKERLEKLQQDQQRQEAEQAKQRAEQLAKDQIEEKERQRKEQEEAEHAFIRKEQKAMEDAKKKQIAEEINAKGIIKVDLQDLDKHTLDDLKNMQIDQLNKEATDLKIRMRNVARKHDHLERAFRAKEAELWIADADAQKARDLKAHEARTASIMASAKAAFEHRQAASKRYERILPQYKAFMDELMATRTAAYEAQKAENDKLLEAAKKERVEKEQARAAEEQRKREEREKREAEEAARSAEEAARRAAEPPKPTAYRPGSLGGARPAPRPSPFGNATPAGEKPSPFGSAKPVSPFGNARPTAATADGAARPSPAPAASKPSPFGNARARPTGASPFGIAKPTETGEKAKQTAEKTAEKPQPKKGGYVPIHLRNKQ